MLFTTLIAAFAVPPPPPPKTFTLVAVGDVLPHRRVKASAAQYGWDDVFAPVQPMLRDADLAFVNLESPIAPTNHLKIEGERFNAPADLATGLATAGFDIFSMANNHVWDQGVAGMLETRDRVVAAGGMPVGVGDTCAQAEAPVRVEVNGIQVAFIALVDLLNEDLRSGPGNPCVNTPGPRCTVDCLPDRDALFFRLDEARLTAMVKNARQGADLVVVSAHWGNEYRTAPLPEYLPLANTLIAAGADLILGHHPHVLQPVQTLEAGGRSGLVAWSLGNFVSDMGRSYDPARHPVSKGNTRDGLVLEVQVQRAHDGVITLKPTLHPTFTTHTVDPKGERIQVVLQTALPESLRAVREPHVATILTGR